MDYSILVLVGILAFVVLLIVIITLVYRLVPPERSGYKEYSYLKSAGIEKVDLPLRGQRATIETPPHPPRLHGKGYSPGRMKIPEESKADSPKFTVTTEYQPKKTVWDWQQLIIIPLVLAVVTVGFTLVQYYHSAWLATDQQQQTTLETYIDRMSDLLLNKSSTTTLLHDSKSLDEVRNVAKARTLIALSRLDPERKGAVVFFLYHADLITWHQWPKTPGYDFPIINLATADLREADLSNIFLNNTYLYDVFMNNASLSNAVLSISDLGDSNLCGADLSEAYLRGTNLNNADLTGANLSGAHLETYTSGLPPHAQQVTDLSGAKLKGADLSGANLNGANLSGADLSGANLNGANLSGADLKGATMPDGSKHP